MDFDIGLNTGTRVWYEKYLAKFATGNIDVWFFIHHTLSNVGELHFVRITNCLTVDSRKSSYFSNGISAWLILLINPSWMYNKISPESSKVVQVFL